VLLVSGPGCSTSKLRNRKAVRAGLSSSHSSRRGLTSHHQLQHFLSRSAGCQASQKLERLHEGLIFHTEVAGAVLLKVSLEKRQNWNSL